jgi:hypothetical protein
MFSADLSICEASGQAVMVLRGELDVMDTASSAFALSAIAQLINVPFVHACAEAEDAAGIAQQVPAAAPMAARGRSS